MATNGCEQKVVVNLISGELNPEEYRTERNATLVNMCVANLRRLLEDGYRAPITEAKLEAEFVADVAGQMGPYLKVPGRFKVCIVLPDGRCFTRIYEKEVLAQG